MSPEVQPGGEGDGQLREPMPESPDAARRAVEQTRQRIDEDLDAIAGRVQGTKHEVVARYEESKAKVMDALEAPARRVRQSPGTSLGIAAGVGLLLGMRTKQRKRRKQREQKILAAAAALEDRERSEHRGLLRRRRSPSERQAEQELSRGPSPMRRIAGTAAVKAGSVAAALFAKRAVRRLIER